MDESQPIGERVAAVIQKGLDAGLSLRESCEDALSWVKRNNLATEVLAELGADALAMFYRNTVHQIRRAALHPGRRKVQADQLNRDEAILEIMCPLGDGKWSRLGDLTSINCSSISEWYRVQGEANLRRSEVFAAIGRAVRQRKAQTVRQAFEGARIAKLAALYRKIDDE